MFLFAADSGGLLSFYLKRPVLPARRPGFNGKVCRDRLQELKSTGKRLWFVCRYSRDKPDQWMWRNAVRMLRIKHQRIDFYQNIVDVYLLSEDAKPSAVAAVGK